MAIGTTSKRYAKALILYSIDQGNLDMLFEEILSLSNTLKESEAVSYTHLTLPTSPKV